MTTPENNQTPSMPVKVLLAVLDLLNIYRPNESDEKVVVTKYPPAEDVFSKEQ